MALLLMFLSILLLCFLRYEDILMHSESALKSLSLFLNEDEDRVDLFHQDVLNWLEMNTRVSAGSRYSTSRNSTEQVFKWRRKISIKLVQDIQKVCSKMMNAFGYVFADSMLELRNIPVSLIRPFT